MAAVLDRWLRVVIVALCGATVASAAEPAVVADDLVGPTAIVARQSTASDERGAYDLFVAEAGAGRVTRFTIGAFPVRAVVADGLANRLEGRGLSLAWVGERSLVVGEHSTGRVLSLPLNGPRTPSPLREFERGDAEIPSGPQSLVVSDRYLFVLRGDELVRARTSGDELTTLRPFATIAGATSLAVSESGYLLLLRADGERLTLEFRDPHDRLAQFASMPVVGIPVAGIESPVALVEGPAGRPTERLLYALVRSSTKGESGVYRLDADEADPAAPSVSAVLMAAVDSPVAMAFAPDGSLLVAVDAAESGRVVRIDDAW
ncbi:MAG: hypothetical protein ACRCT8_15715 [Lacipirellulaceae bacterium]